MKQFRASLDGVDVTHDCFRADDATGLVWCYSWDRDGSYFFDYEAGQSAQSCCKGIVVITRA